MFALLFLLLQVLSSVSLGTELRIENADDFVDFSKIVNSGISYNGTTIFLDADIDFTEKHIQQFEPIGKDTVKFFNGTFDGQGHTIRNLRLTTSLTYAGLFGYSNGLTIKNIVLDSSSSVVSTNTDANSFVGGLIGYCYSKKGACNIENCVNMASVTFKGTTKQTLYLGGLVGYLYVAGRNSLVSNTANYGIVTHSGKSRYSYVGGVAGRSDGYSGFSLQPNRVSLQNVLNYGNVVHIGITSSWLHTGGIMGHIYYNDVDNCLSYGSIAYSGTSKYIGSIAGNAFASSFSHCYWSELSKYDMCGTMENSTVTDGVKFNEDTLRLLKDVSVGGYTGDSLIGALNADADYNSLNNYAHWAFNTNKSAVSFKINNKGNGITLNSRIVLLPNLANGGKMWFDGWYTDSACEVPFVASEISSAMTLYGKWESNTNSYTITFSTRGGSPVEPEPITAQYLSVVQLPSDIKKNRKCKITAWETDKGYVVPWSFTVPAHDITLYATLLCNYIASAEDFIKFMDNVTSGMNYSGTTVYLDADVDLSGIEFEPIGKADSDMFLGTFDGQGHIISNLEINTTLMYVGIFGYSKGLTVKNVVIDASCSVVREASTAHAYIGGLVGYCNANIGYCNIESIVNMASVTFNGDAAYYLYLGGIAGDLDSMYARDCIVKNSANYGTVTNAGTSKFSRTGGIIGFSKGYTTQKRVNIQNCLNYGSVVNSGITANNIYLGGISGDCKICAIENCVNDGPLASRNSSNWIGSITGGVTTAVINLCFWTSNVGCSKACGAGTSTVDNETSQVELVPEVLAKLNNYSDTFSWNGWILNTQNASVSFIINNGNELVLSSRIVLLPDPAESSERTFSGWFRDEILTEPFTDDEVESDTTLYGMLCAPNYTVILDVNGGDASSLPFPTVDVMCNKFYGELPTPKKTGYVLDGWFTERVGGKKVASGDRVTIINDHTLFAQWSIGRFTVELDVNGGDELAIKEIEVTIDSPYGPLPTPNRSGYVFLGWFTEDNELVTSETIVTIARNHTLQAHWRERPSDKVEIVFKSKDLTKKEAEDIARRYTSAEFKVLKYINDEPEGVRVVLKFADVNDAESFVETVRAASEAMGMIKRIGFTLDESFSPVLYPAMLFGLFI